MKLHFTDVSSNILDIKVDKRNEVFNFGLDNAYPSLIDALVDGSVTAKSCIDKVSKAIYGKSFGDAGLAIANNKGQTFNEVLRIAGREYAKYSNTYLHISYNANFQISSVVVVPVTHVRKGKADDKGYSGKFVIYDNWDKKSGARIESRNFRIVHPYNPKEEVIKSQILKAGGLKKYKGQLLHIQEDSNAVYSLSPLHPVLDEALVEYNSMRFRSQGSAKGFLNTKLMVVKPFANDEDRRLFKKELDKVRGAEGAGGVLLLESTNLSDDLKKEYGVEDLTTSFDDELFKYSDEQARKNIALAFEVPLSLVDVSDSSLFGNSGELIKQMKVLLWESQEEPRDMIEEAFNRITKNWKEELGELKITNPYIQA